ncbi:MAG: hypothetical protein LH650_16115, partial [Chloroflexi bacterium]|nr:hypothetical protein [Chloroflexota bacterium]
LTLHYKSTAAAKLRVTVTASSDTVVRTFSVAGKKGSSSLVWNGKTNSGAIAPDGTYAVKVQIVGGNSKTTSVKVLTAIKVPVTSRVLMHASDGDSLAKSAKQSVAVRANAHLRWRILDAYGDVVRTGIDNERVGRGTTTWTWDGKDDAGAYVPDGVYTSIVTATTSKGAYSHQVTIRVMPYSVVGDFVQRPGQWNTFAVYAAETQKVAPTITVKQPGMAAYKLTLKKVTTNRWSAIWKARPGKTGAATFTISGTDELGGKQSSGWKGTIQ